jgi:glycosyltransferase involved in cell wall biosynthesis
VRILLVTQMWPTVAQPELGSFLVPLVRELRALGHDVEVAAIGRQGATRARHARLLGTAVRAARRRAPDVVFAHFLFPAGAAGLAAARAARVPLVVMAHGQDVANADRALVRPAVVGVVRSAAAVIVNSRWLGARLRAHVPGVAFEVCDLGVDLRQFTPGVAPAAWVGDHPRFLCVGALTQRKNVVALADAFAALGRGSLTFVGEGPLRPVLEGRPGVTLTGRIPHAQVPGWMAAADVVCQPSQQEAFGLAALEAMALERTVVATRDGGPPEFVTPAAGLLVDPGDAAGLCAALEAAAAMPSPNRAARRAAAEHDVVRQAARMAAVLERAVAAQAVAPAPRFS